MKDHLYHKNLPSKLVSN